MRAWSLAVLSPIQKYSLLYSKILKQKLKNLRALRSFSEVGKTNIKHRNIMKKQLLTALLAFVTIPFFASQQSNAELLTHLKNVRIDVEKMQEKLAVGLKELPEGYGQENYFFLLN